MNLKADARDYPEPADQDYTPCDAHELHDPNSDHEAEDCRWKSEREYDEDDAFEDAMEDEGNARLYDTLYVESEPQE